MPCNLTSNIEDNSSSIDVSVCIVNWNTKYLTSQLIESIHKTVKKLSIEVFIVDNASTDGSVEHILNNYPNVNIIKNSVNVGYGSAHNQALRMSRGRYKMILNSDVILLEKSLENMVMFLDNNQDIGAVGPICLDRDRNIGYSYGHFPKPWQMILERLLGSMTPKYIKPPPLQVKPQVYGNKQIDVEYILGACILIRKELCDEIGLFDERFFAYFEETDWCFRMMKRGVKRCLIPNAEIIHINDASFSQLPERGTNYFADSKIKYLKKHYGKTIAKVYICSDTFANFRHIIKKTLLSLCNRTV
ncbi:MAG: glycosyltransferase family 2 protein [Syntrophales bacterium]